LDPNDQPISVFLVVFATTIIIAAESPVADRRGATGNSFARTNSFAASHADSLKKLTPRSVFLSI